MEDLSYQEAMKQATGRASSELTTMLMLASLRVQQGQNAEEATKDIGDPDIRDIVKHTLLAMQLQIVVGVCRDSQVITQAQCEELLAYITKIGTNYIAFLANQE